MSARKRRTISQAEVARRCNKRSTQLTRYRRRDWWTWGEPPYTKKQAAEIEDAIRKLPPSHAAGEQQPDLPAAADPPGVDWSKAIAGLPVAQRIKLNQVLARTSLVELERSLKAGDYLPKAEVEAGRVERISAVKTAMLAVADSGVVEAIRNAESDAEARQVLRGRMIEICQEFSRESSARRVV